MEKIRREGRRGKIVKEEKKGSGDLSEVALKAKLWLLTSLYFLLNAI